ncbi:hypothetical protein EW146_g8057 [Bondarzewia mesenterica]|uniref:Opi1-domain-containing protein n=1 Tax=Bondarzewia mesenterica TaxID=1095465 RepID=A0A4S4LHC6_9AGAM|nr:hypothetical protein EW146_g8057 [Bondarzewia mesenterica]
MQTQQMRQRTIEDEDESVRIAVRALGDMRSRAVASHAAVAAAQSQSASSFQPTPALSIASSSTSPTLPSPVLSPEEPIDMDSPDFVSRMSTLPIVNTALRAYEQSKASSRVVKVMIIFGFLLLSYGAEMMESSVKSISRPVMDRLPVNQLDEFACRQLDRLGRYGARRPASVDRMVLDEQDLGSGNALDGIERGRGSWESGLQMRDVSMTRGYRGREESAVRDEGKEGSPMRGMDGRVQSPRSMDQDESGEQQQRQVAQRSRWQAVLLEAGGIGAAVSEESMRRLKYCLQWLQYATTHIDGQILVLRDFMASLQPPPGSPNAINPDGIISPEHMRQLANVKRDVVDTIRQVVDVVSKYAGGALPEPARARVRGFILHLPQAWASAARRQGQQDGPSAGAANPARGRGTRRNGRRERGGENSRPVSPSNASSPRHSRQSSSAISAPSAAVPPTAGSATQAAQRILTLATESLDMMRGVTAVVKDSLDRADAWVERLRVVGLQRQGGGQAGSGDVGDGERLPPLMQHRGMESVSVLTSASTSVTSSPVVRSAVLPPLRSPAVLSPLVHASGDSYFGAPEGQGSAVEFGKLSLGGGASGAATPAPALGKKGMFAEEGEKGVGHVNGNGIGSAQETRWDREEAKEAKGQVQERQAEISRDEDDGGTPKMDVDG